MRQILWDHPLPLSALLLRFDLDPLSPTLSILFFGEMDERSRAKGPGHLDQGALRPPTR